MCRGLVLCFVGLLIFSVTAFAQPQYGFRISFTDKAGTTLSLSNPQGFLSQRAIDRRTKFSITIDSTDLPVSPAYLDTVLAETSGKLHMTSRWFNYTVVLLTDSSKILTLQNKPYVKSIEYIAYYPSGLHKPSKNNVTTSGSTYLPLKTTGSAAYYGASYNQVNLVNGDYLHDIGRKGEGKLIAVLDEGFDAVNTAPAFDSMYNSGRLKDQYNFVDNSTNVFTLGLHGTTSLSTMAGNLPGTYVGTAPYADYALYNTEIPGSEQVIEMDNIVAASERADSIGADIITISLGYDRFNLPTNFSLTYADIDGKTTIGAKAANTATSKGIVFVASAGNEGGGSWNYILTPGDADSAITVGSVGLDKVPAGNSGYGPNSAGHIKPNVCMSGQPASVMRNGPSPTFSSGTSFATPQLAGWVACLMQSTKNYTPYQIRTAIEKSAHVYNNPGVQLGYGVPNFHYALQLLGVDDVNTGFNNDNWIGATPNPFTDLLSLQVYRDTNGILELVMNDISGRVVYSGRHSLSQGLQIVNINTAHLPRGVYLLKALTEDQKKVIKAVKY